MNDDDTADRGPVDDPRPEPPREVLDPPPAPVEDRPLDPVPVTAFVLSLVGVGIVAIPLAVWGLVRGRSGSRRGRGFAVAALGISAAWAVAASALVLATSGLLGGGGGLTGLAEGSPPAGLPVATPSVSATATLPATTGTTPATGPTTKAKKVYWQDLKPTMCVLEIPASAMDVRVVDCRTEHSEEVIARTVLDGTRKWPGDEALDTAAGKECSAAFAAYIGIGYDDSRLEVDYLTTDQDGWRAGDRTLVCLVYDPADPTLDHALKGAAE